MFTFKFNITSTLPDKRSNSHILLTRFFFFLRVRRKRDRNDINFQERGMLFIESFIDNKLIMVFFWRSNFLIPLSPLPKKITHLRIVFNEYKHYYYFFQTKITILHYPVQIPKESLTNILHHFYPTYEVLPCLFFLLSILYIGVKSITKK